jgi:hypothetical protein
MWVESACCGTREGTYREIVLGKADAPVTLYLGRRYAVMFYTWGH